MADVRVTTRVEFDQAKVRRTMERRGQRFLADFGEHVAEDARSSIRPATDGRSSRPGEPPRSHTGRLRSGIVYGLASDQKSVAIGTTQEGPGGDVNVPAILEHGGRTRIRPRPRNSPRTRRQSDWMLRRSVRSSQDVIWDSVNRAAAVNYGWKGRLVVIIARPFLQPALERAMFHTIRFWERTIDG